MPKRAYVVDGKTFGSLAEAAAVFTRVLELTTAWDGSLAALPALIRGGFGTPHDGFVLVWKNSGVSRDKLNHRALVQPLRGLAGDDPRQAAALEERISDAKGRRGPTLFDTLVEVFRAQEGVEVRCE